MMEVMFTAEDGGGDLVSTSIEKVSFVMEHSAWKVIKWH